MAVMPKTDPTQIKARRFRVVIIHLYLRTQYNYRRAQETYQRITEDNCYEENSLQSGELVLRQRNSGISPVVYPDFRKFMEGNFENVRNFLAGNHLIHSEKCRSCTCRPRDRRDIAAVYKCSHHSTTPEAGREFSTPRSSHMRKKIIRSMVRCTPKFKSRTPKRYLRVPSTNLPKRYAWSAKLPLSILTDFAELAVSD